MQFVVEKIFVAENKFVKFVKFVVENKKIYCYENKILFDYFVGSGIVSGL